MEGFGSGLGGRCSSPGDDSDPLVVQAGWGSSHLPVREWYLNSVGILPTYWFIPVPEIIMGYIVRHNEDPTDMTGEP